MTTRSLVLGSLFLLACSNGSSKNPDLATVTHDMATAVDQSVPGDLAGVCNTLTVGADVNLATSNATAPAFTGGSIVDGTYVLTSATLYGDSPDGGLSASLGITLSVQGSVIQQNSDQSGGSSTSSFTASGTMLTLVDTCPDTSTTVFEYSATSTTLSLGSTQSGLTTLFVFTKQ